MLIMLMRLLLLLRGYYDDASYPSHTAQKQDLLAFSDIAGSSATGRLCHSRNHSIATLEKQTSVSHAGS